MARRKSDVVELTKDEFQYGKPSGENMKSADSDEPLPPPVDTHLASLARKMLDEYRWRVTQVAAVLTGSPARMDAATAVARAKILMAEAGISDPEA